MSDGRGRYGSAVNTPMANPRTAAAPRWLSAAGLVAVNAVPLVGVLVFGWSVPGIFLMYWIEMGVIGPVNALKIVRTLRVSGDGSGSGGGAIVRGAGTGSRTLALGWLGAYLVFWAVLGLAVMDIANGGFYEGRSATGWTGAPVEVVALGAAALVAGQLAAWYLDYVRGRRYLTVSSLELLRDPFVRVFVLVGAIAVGGIGTAVAGSVGFLVALIVVKIAVEIWFLAPLKPPRQPQPPAA